MVVLMTNVLRKNSACDHMSLAGSIDKYCKKIRYANNYLLRKYFLSFSADLCIRII